MNGVRSGALAGSAPPPHAGSWLRATGPTHAPRRSAPRGCTPARRAPPRCCCCRAAVTANAARGLAAGPTTASGPPREMSSGRSIIFLKRRRAELRARCPRKVAPEAQLVRRVLVEQPAPVAAALRLGLLAEAQPRALVAAERSRCRSGDHHAPTSRTSLAEALVEEPLLCGVGRERPRLPVGGLRLGPAAEPAQQVGLRRREVW